MSSDARKEMSPLVVNMRSSMGTKRQMMMMIVGLNSSDAREEEMSPLAYSYSDYALIKGSKRQIMMLLDLMSSNVGLTY